MMQTSRPGSPIHIQRGQEQEDDVTVNRQHVRNISEVARLDLETTNWIREKDELDSEVVN
jgi:hypothetical protein